MGSRFGFIDQKLWSHVIMSFTLFSGPNDPFTSLPFVTKEREPVPNNILKIRIDQFLSQNHESLNKTELISNKRIAGYSSHLNNGLITSRLINESNSSVIKEDICSECKVKHNSEDIFYKMSCNHLICRKEWLKKLNDNKITKRCDLCNQKISNNDIVKVQKII